MAGRTPWNRNEDAGGGEEPAGLLERRRLRRVFRLFPPPLPQGTEEKKS